MGFGKSFKRFIHKTTGLGGGGVSAGVIAQQNYAKAEEARNKLNIAGVDTRGMSQATLLGQYGNGYTMIAQRNAQTANEYFAAGGGIGESGVPERTNGGGLLGWFSRKKKTLLGSYGEDGAGVLGG